MLHDMNKKRALTVALLLGQIFFPDLLLAAEPGGPDLSLDQLLQTEVMSAAQISRQVSDAPSVVYVVTAEDIRAFGYQTLADVLYSLPGLYKTYDYRYSSLGGRAQSGSLTGKTLLNIDGFAAASNLTDRVGLDNGSLVEVDMIDRVEYIPGSGSAVYGNNALYGVINVFTKKGRDLKGAEVALDHYSYDGNKARISYGNKLDNGMDVMVSASAQTSHGQQNIFIPEFKDPSGLSRRYILNLTSPSLPVLSGSPVFIPFNLSTVAPSASGPTLYSSSDGATLPFSSNFANGVVSSQDGEDAHRIVFKIGSNNWILEAGLFDRQKYFPTGAQNAVFGLPNFVQDAQSYINFKIDTSLKDSLQSSSSFYLGSTKSGNRSYYLDPYSFPSTGGIGLFEFKEENRGDWVGIDQKIIASWFNSHKLLGGIEVRNDYNLHWGHSLPPCGTNTIAFCEFTNTGLTSPVYINFSEHTDHTRISESVYIQDEIQIDQQFVLTLGARYDNQNDVGGRMSPRLAGVYSPNPEDILKFALSQAHRFPSDYQLHWIQSLYPSSNPNLKPESANLIDIVYEHAFSSNARGTLTLYHYIGHDLIGDPILGGSYPVAGFFAGIPSNGGASQTTGIELEFQKKWDNNSRVRFSYAYQNSQDTSSNWTANSPRHLFKSLFATPTPLIDMNMALEVQYVGPMRTLEKDFYLLSSGTVLLVLHPRQVLFHLS